MIGLRGLYGIIKRLYTTVEQCNLVICTIVFHRYTWKYLMEIWEESKILHNIFFMAL